MDNESTPIDTDGRHKGVEIERRLVEPGEKLAIDRDEIVHTRIVQYDDQQRRPASGAPFLEVWIASETDTAASPEDSEERSRRRVSGLPDLATPPDTSYHELDDPKNEVAVDETDDSDSDTDEEETPRKSLVTPDMIARWKRTTANKVAKLTDEEEEEDGDGDESDDEVNHG